MPYAHPTKKCTFPDCGRPVECRGLCHAHYEQQRNNKELTPLKLYKVDAVCAFPDCDRRVGLAEFCQQHRRQQTEGKQLTAIRTKKNNGLPRGSATTRVNGLKQCYGCLGWFEPTVVNFGRRANTRDGLSERCGSCRHIKQIADSTRDILLRRFYRITEDEFNAILESQGGVCAICKRTPEEAHRSGKAFAVDHDHGHCPGNRSCGECIRGILCDACNRGMGNLGDDPGRLRSAADYLDNWKEVPDGY